MIMSTAYQHWTFTPAVDDPQTTDLQRDAPVPSPEADRSGSSEAAPGAVAGGPGGSRAGWTDAG
jgi:hypothetical protein